MSNGSGVPSKGSSQDELVGERIRRKYQALGGLDAADLLFESYLTPDNLAVDSPHYDVYFEGSQLLFVAKDCHAAAADGLFARATTVDATPLGLAVSLRRRFRASPHNRCMTSVSLRGLRASHILVGQRDSSGLLWSGEIFLDREAFEKTMEDMLLAAGEPVIESDMDVYIDGWRIFYVSDDCQRTDGQTPFFLHVTPMRETDVPPELNMEQGYVDKSFRAVGATVNMHCIVRRKLPRYPIRSIRTGQYLEAMEGDEPLARTLWEGEVKRAGFEKALEEKQAGFEKAMEDMLLAAGEPIIESYMDVYVDGRRIFYVSDDCQRMDGQTPFFLHVTPTREAYLPSDRIESGYDNRDFRQAGVTVGERCVVRWQLPLYPVRRIRTGQYVEVVDGDERRLQQLWAGEAQIGE